MLKPHLKSNALLTQPFLSLFGVQFLGALNDNLYKNALVVWISFGLDWSAEKVGLWITLAAGLFILPFFLFSNWAGYWADHHNKVVLIRWIKIAEIGIMALAVLAWQFHSWQALIALLFLMGTQSALFGPIKYSILPEYLPPQRLDAGNAWFSASTFIAILLGTLLGGWWALTGHDVLFLALIGVALAGWLFSLGIPPEPLKPVQEGNKPQRRSLWQLLRQSRAFPKAFQAVLFISWFWVVGALFLGQMPLLVKVVDSTLPAEQITTWLLLAFTLGIALGAFVIAKAAERTKKPLSQLGLVLISMGSALLAWQLSFESALSDVQAGVILMGIAFGGGLYIVPFYKVMQLETPAHFRASMVATNNILNAFFMVLLSIIIMIVYALGLQFSDILWALALLNGLVLIQRDLCTR
jgi:MFS family permease